MHLGSVQGSAFIQVVLSALGLKLAEQTLHNLIEFTVLHSKQFVIKMLHS
jgi:hypothetical protein